MPEGLEAEIWRRASGVLVGRRITQVRVDERVATPGMDDELVGRRIVAVRRRGKVVVLDTDGPSLGLRFGMTGRLVIDGTSPIERLEYASNRDRAEWDRLRLWTGASAEPALRMNDPRRLGRLTLDPDLEHLGVDMFDLDRPALESALADRTTAVKSALLNQEVVAGLGNLCADEVLWWSGIAPGRSADQLQRSEISALTTAIRRRLPIMLRRGGSTTGSLSPSVRAAPDPCPKDGNDMRRTRIGGRTSVWCPHHQH